MRAAYGSNATRWARRTLGFALVLGIWGCPPPEGEEMPPPDEQFQAPEEEAAAPAAASAEMIDSDGETVGTLSFTSQNDEVRVEGTLTLSDGTGGSQGFHIHETGECQPPDFESAGGHYNPQDRPHGGPDDAPDERHTGDLGNVEVDEDGRAEIDLTDDVIELGSGTDGVVGLSVLVHAEEDDLTTQPSGDAGDRVACGVLQQ